MKTLIVAAALLVMPIASAHHQGGQLEKGHQQQFQQKQEIRKKLIEKAKERLKQRQQRLQKQGMQQEAVTPNEE
jgi:hypothetical protein